MLSITLRNLLALAFLLPSSFALPTANPLPPRSASTWSIALFTSPVCSFEDPTNFPYKTYSGISTPLPDGEEPKCWTNDLNAGEYRPIQLPGNCEVTFYNDDACKEGTDEHAKQAGFLNADSYAQDQCWKPWQPIKTFKVVCT